MNINAMLKSARLLGGQAYLLAAKYGPTVMTVAGVAGTVVSTVMACKATTKLEDVVKAGDKKIAKAHKNFEKIQENPENYEPYSQDDFNRELVVLHTKKWFDVVKLYAPAAGVGILSIAGILGSHKIMTGRNTALAAAYEALNISYKKFRENVKFEFGSETEALMRNGEIVGENENGDLAEVKITPKSISEGNPYGFWFDPTTSVQFRNDPLHNLNFLIYVMRHLNSKLQANGYVFLNEALEDLGMARTSAGSVCGWSLKSEGPGMDHHIDFGLSDPINVRFMAEDDSVVFLNFNCNGDIHRLI